MGGLKPLVQVATCFGILPPWGAVGVGVASSGTAAAVLAHADSVVYAVLAATYAAAAGLLVLLVVLVRRGRESVTPRAEIARMARSVRTAAPVPSPRRRAARPPAAILRPRIVAGAVIRTEAASETRR